jgi:hypothetical protein
MLILSPSVVSVFSSCSWSGTYHIFGTVVLANILIELFKALVPPAPPVPVKVRRQSVTAERAAANAKTKETAQMKIEFPKLKELVLELFKADSDMTVSEFRTPYLKQMAAYQVKSE